MQIETPEGWSIQLYFRESDDAYAQGRTYLDAFQKPEIHLAGHVMHDGLRIRHATYRVSVSFDVEKPLPYFTAEQISYITVYRQDKQQDRISATAHKAIVAQATYLWVHFCTPERIAEARAEWIKNAIHGAYSSINKLNEQIDHYRQRIANLDRLAARSDTITQEIS